MEQKLPVVENWELLINTKNLESEGIIISLIDSVATITNLNKVLMGEVLTVVGAGVKALVINISEDSIKAIVLSGEDLIMPGFNVLRTKNLFRFPVTSQLLGRVVDAFGNPIDIGKSFKYKANLRNIEIKAPGIISRYKVNEPLQTGIKAVDSLIPIGRGQRELIIGDKSTGKTTVAIDSILNQKQNA